jgi:hypothetical protein
MSKLYRKTEKGLVEMTTRAHRLTPKLRAALILVDGKRTDEELMAMIMSEPEETLRWLSESGFIEPAANASRWNLSEQSPQAASRLDGTSLQEPITQAGHTAAPSRHIQFALNLLAPIDMLQRDSVRYLNDVMGPMGESLSIKIERAKRPDELHVLLNTAHQVIENSWGAGKAADFHARYLGDTVWSPLATHAASPAPAVAVASKAAATLVNSHDMRRSPAPQDNPPPASRMPIEQIKREAVSFLNACAGPAGEGLALKIEKARSREELLPLLKTASQSIYSLRGMSKASEFHDKFVEGMMV